MTAQRAFALLLLLPLAAVHGRTAASPAAKLAGTVVDEAGRPAAGIAVELVPERRGPYGGVHGESGPYRAVTGPEGRFEIPGVPTGVATLGIARPGFPLSRVRSLRIPEGARTDVGRLELPAGRTIAGRALNPQGQPLAGVEVWVAPPGDSVLQATWKRQIEAGPQAVTGPDGRFSVPSVEKKARLVLCRAGYQSTRPAESGDVTLQPVVRVPRARIAGRVVTASGDPVTGARVGLDVFVLGCGYQSLVFDPCPPEKAPAPPDPVTGPDGRFVLEVEGSGAQRLWTQPAGFTRAVSQEVRYGPDESPFVEIVVDRGAVVTGRISTPQGKPAAGVEVFIDSGVRTVTGADGAFRLEGVEPGRRSFTASHRELGRVSRRVDVAPGGTRQDFTLDGQGVREIRGRVLSPDGGPLPGARVWLDCPDCQDSVWSAGDGSFTLTASERQHKEIHAQRAGLLPGRAPLPPGNAPVDGLEIRLERGIVLTGRVLDAEPRHRLPLPERFREQLLRISVSARPVGGEWQNAFVEVDGTYRFESLSPGGWEVVAYALDRRHTERVVLEPGLEEAVLDLRLSPAYEIRGRLIDGEGRPVRGLLHIFAESPSGASAGSRPGSQEDGSFIAWLQEGSYTLRATAPEHAPATSTLHVDGPVSGLEIRLEEDVVLRGRLLGIVPGNMTMISTRDVIPPSSVRIAPDGTYRLTGLGPGTWEIEATHQEADGAMRKARFSVEIAPGSPEVIRDVDLAAGSFVLSGRLLAPNEEPVSASLQLVRADGVEIRWSGGVSPDGEFRVPGLAPGRYRIEVTDQMSNERVLTREVEMEGDREVEIEMEDGR